MNKKHWSIIQIYILSISMHIQNLIEIYKLIHKILSINKILTLNKGHNSVKNWLKIMWIRYNMDLVCINAYTKFYQNSSICSEDIEEKRFLHQSWAIIPCCWKTNLAHYQSQTTPPWYQCPYKDWRNRSKTTLEGKSQETKRWWTGTQPVRRV